MISRPTMWLLLFVAAGFTHTAIADDGAALKLADGKMEFTCPAGWKQTKPSSRILDHELAVPAVEGDSNNGRVTLMGAGGSVQANIDRWIGQFSQPDGKSTRKIAVIKEEKIAGQQVHLIDLTGTFKDQRGHVCAGDDAEELPDAGGHRGDRRTGSVLCEVYGPRKTVAANEKAFDQFINSLTLK